METAVQQRHTKINNWWQHLQQSDYPKFIRWVKDGLVCELHASVIEAAKVNPLRYMWLLNTEPATESDFIKFNQGAAAKAESNFIKDCIIGIASAKDIDSYINQWHESDNPKPLHEFLGLTLAEYGEYVKDENNLTAIIAKYK